MKKRIISGLLAIALLISLMPAITTTASAATTLSYAPYANVEYSYSSGVAVGTIRYIQQIPNASYFYSAYWPSSTFGGYAGSSTECGTASISMALSYVGVNETPKHLLESTNGYTAQMWTTYGNTTCSSIGTSASAISSAMNNYINGNGKYSPLVIQMTPYPSSGNQHFVILAGKISDNKYFVVDPARPDGWTMTVSGSSASLSWTSGTYPITSVHQWHNPNASRDVTVTFNANGGSCSTSTKTVSTDAELGEVPYPTRDGYIFDGWYTSASGGSRVSAGTTISSDTTLYAQWNNDYVDLGTGFYASIVNAGSGLSVVNNAENVELGEYGADNSIWYFERCDEGCYMVFSAVDGRAIDVYNADTVDGTNIWVHERNDTHAQKWFIRDTESGYIFLSKISGKALDINGAGVEIGCNAQIWTLNNSSAQLMEITEAYAVTYDANGGADAPERQWKLENVALRLVDTVPSGKEVPFLGWSTNKNAKIAEYAPGDLYTANENATLFAVWGCAHEYIAERTEGNCQTPGYTTYTCTECGDAYTVYDGEVSEWSTTKPTGVDENLIETKTQYRYADKETKTSYEVLDDWKMVGSSWQKSGSGSIQYVKSWPAGFATSHSLYSTYNKSPKSASLTETDETRINSDNVSGYLYYHWCRGTYTSGPINRGSKNTQQGEYTAFHAFYSTTEPGSLTADDDGSVIHSNRDCCKDSYWYFYVPVYTQSYTTYRNLFSYERWGSWSDWSDTVYTSDSNRKVETRTLYRYVTGGTGDHNYSDGYCTVCGEVDPDYEFIPAQITVGNVTANQGETVTVSVIINDNPGFAGFTFVIDYDNTALTLTNISKGDALAVSEIGSFTKNVSNGVVTWTDIENLTGNGVLLELTFTIQEDAEAGTYEIGLGLKDNQSTNFVDENSRSVNVEFAGGTIAVTDVKPVVTLTKIEIASAPTKTVYQIGEALDTTGLTLKGTYSDGSNQTITSGFTTSGFGSATAGTKTVTVSYGGMSTSFTVTVQQQAETDPNGPHIVIEDVTARAGETINVSVYIERNPSVAYAKFKVDYPESFQLLSAEDQGVLTGTFTTSQTTQVKPYVLQWMGADDSVDNGCFVVLSFRIAEDVTEGDYEIRIKCEEAYNSAYDEVTFAVTNSVVTVKTFTSGDVNDDGKVNGKDGIMLAQYLAEWEISINLNAADVNGDGKVNGRDGILLAQYLAEWNVTLG